MLTEEVANGANLKYKIIDDGGTFVDWCTKAEFERKKTTRGLEHALRNGKQVVKHAVKGVVKDVREAHVVQCEKSKRVSTLTGEYPRENFFTVPFDAKEASFRQTFEGTKSHPPSNPNIAEYNDHTATVDGKKVGIYADGFEDAKAALDLGLKCQYLKDVAVMKTEYGHREAVCEFAEKLEGALAGPDAERVRTLYKDGISKAHRRIRGVWSQEEQWKQQVGDAIVRVGASCLDALDKAQRANCPSSEDVKRLLLVYERLQKLKQTFPDERWPALEEYATALAPRLERLKQLFDAAFRIYRDTDCQVPGAPFQDLFARGAAGDATEESSSSAMVVVPQGQLDAELDFAEFTARRAPDLSSEQQKNVKFHLEGRMTGLVDVFEQLAHIPATREAIDAVRERPSWLMHHLWVLEEAKHEVDGGVSDWRTIRERVALTAAYESVLRADDGVGAARVDPAEAQRRREEARARRNQEGVMPPPDDLLGMFHQCYPDSDAVRLVAQQARNQERGHRDVIQEALCNSQRQVEQQRAHIEELQECMEDLKALVRAKEAAIQQLTTPPAAAATRSPVMTRKQIRQELAQGETRAILDAVYGLAWNRAWKDGKAVLVHSAVLTFRDPSGASRRMEFDDIEAFPVVLDLCNNRLSRFRDRLEVGDHAYAGDVVGLLRIDGPSPVGRMVLGRPDCGTPIFAVRGAVRLSDGTELGDCDIDVGIQLKDPGVTRAHVDAYGPLLDQAVKAGVLEEAPVRELLADAEETIRLAEDHERWRAEEPERRLAAKRAEAKLEASRERASADKQAAKARRDLQEAELRTALKAKQPVEIVAVRAAVELGWQERKYRRPRPPQGTSRVRRCTPFLSEEDPDNTPEPSHVQQRLYHVTCKHGDDPVQLTLFEGEFQEYGLHQRQDVQDAIKQHVEEMTRTQLELQARGDRAAVEAMNAARQRDEKLKEEEECRAQERAAQEERDKEEAERRAAAKKEEAVQQAERQAACGDVLRRLKDPDGHRPLADVSARVKALCTEPDVATIAVSVEGHSFTFKWPEFQQLRGVGQEVKEKLWSIIEARRQEESELDLQTRVDAARCQQALDRAQAQALNGETLHLVLTALRLEKVEVSPRRSSSLPPRDEICNDDTTQLNCTFVAGANRLFDGGKTIRVTLTMGQLKALPGFNDDRYQDKIDDAFNRYGTLVSNCKRQKRA